jgi:hypothetical protein
VYRDHPTLYPGRHVIRPGRPLVVTEGEFDAWLLGQELGDLAAVVTLGSASARPAPGILGAMLAATPWFVATDADNAGDRAAEECPAPARRVRPPFKDWGESRKHGVDLRCWSVEAMARETFLARLQGRGIRLDGRLVHPKICVGTVTGRITYVDPALQSMPEADRLARLAPVVEGRRFVRADFGQIGPRIMLSILRRCGLIGWDAGDDLYLDLAGDAGVDREGVKTAVNRIINGGLPDAGATGRLAAFIAAATAYRADLAADALTRGHVATLAGRLVPLAPSEDNHPGKAVNRVVQGTAADVFNRAVEGIDRDLGPVGDVAYLLYDEVGVECDPEHAATVANLIRSEMVTAGLELGIHLPARIDPDPGPTPRFSWNQLSRWRWGPSLDNDEPGIVV